MVEGVEAPLERGTSMGEVGVIGLDLAKNMFQAHGAGTDGSVLFRRNLSRAQTVRRATSFGAIALQAAVSLA